MGCETVGEGRLPPDRVGGAGQPQLGVIGQGEGIALRVDDLGEEDLSRIAAAAIGLGIDLDAAVGP
jgi:hypothetical protein